jgi:hypothetical protein
MNSHLSVFVCGTYEDLNTERGAVLDALQRLEIEHHSMELFGARPQRPLQTCLDEVRKSRIVVVIVGQRYGTLAPGLGISYSEAEYQEAFALNLECLVYFQVVPHAQTESDEAQKALLKKWKETLAERHTPAYFTDPHKLALQVAIDVGRTIRKIEDDDRASGEKEALASTSSVRNEASDVSRIVPTFSERFGDESRQLLHGLATDLDGNIFIVGDFWGSIDFGIAKLVSAGDQDIFLAKFNKTGECLWSQRCGDRSEQVGIGVGTDTGGSVYVASAFTGTLNFGGADLVSQGRYNVALAKLAPNGGHQWSRCFGDDGYHVVECIAVAPAGWVVVAGRFQGSIDFGGGVLRSESAQTDIFIAAFSSDGGLRWAKRFGGAYEQQTRSVAIGTDGNIGLTGVFKGSILFDDLSLTELQPTEYCGFLAMVDQSGSVHWCKRFGDPWVEQGSVVALDPTNGDILTAGFMRNKLPHTPSREASTICLFARYDPAGVLQWSRAFGADATASSVSVAADRSILLTGAFQGTIDFGLGPLASAGGYDVFVAKFNPDGSTKWVRRYGDERHQFVVQGVHGIDRSVILAGSFHGTIDFGRGALVASGYDGAAEGNEDVFLAILQEGIAT